MTHQLVPISDIINSLKPGQIIGEWKVNKLFPEMKTIEIVHKHETFERPDWNYGVLMENQIRQWIATGSF